MKTGDDQFLRPRLRGTLEAIAITHENEEYWLLRDRQGDAPDAIVPREMGALLALLDGSRTRDEIDAEIERNADVPEGFLDDFLAQLDEALLLDSPHFRAHQQEQLENYLSSPTRESTLAGRAYPDDTARLRKQLNGYFLAARKIEVRSKTTVLPEKIRGCIVPHIDFRRGGVAEALAYESLQNEKFDTLVILGIAHAGVRYPFCLLPKGFETPLGTARCDDEFCASLEKQLGPRLTAEALTHRDEHSVEFVAVFAQHLANLRDARIVPIICGGFFRELQNRTSPSHNADLTEFARVLRQTCGEWTRNGKRVGIICSVDGAHVGSNFDDDTPLTPERLAEIEREDVVAWQCVENGDREAFHAALAKDNNARNVDAHPAVYTTLLAFPEWRARLLHYDQAFSEEENSVVSFAALQLFEP
ncbi:MAG TPA: AmmeMemoRadiSam system protein B [Abditibacteriaceae bacterium]|jgi:hypothetical protein